VAEFIINIAPEKEALVKELIEQFGGKVMEKSKKRTKSKIKKGDGKKIGSPTFLFGKWKDFDIDPKKLRDELWTRKF